jgi:putative oxidoreductase
MSIFDRATARQIDVGLAILRVIIELVGGLALILGLFTRVFGFLLACDMFGAIVLVRAKGGFFAPNGTEFELALCAIAVTLAVVGAGGFSADGVLARRRASL